MRVRKTHCQREETSSWKDPEAVFKFFQGKQLNISIKEGKIRTGTRGKT